VVTECFFVERSDQRNAQSRGSTRIRPGLDKTCDRVQKVWRIGDHTEAHRVARYIDSLDCDNEMNMRPADQVRSFAGPFIGRQDVGELQHAGTPWHMHMCLARRCNRIHPFI
jgi:hypothetical protein